MLHEDAQYFPAFRVSQSYISLLAELDLLRDCESTTADDSESFQLKFSKVFIQKYFFFFLQQFHFLQRIVPKV